MKPNYLLAHYGLAFLILSVYGVKVCPFIETLSLPMLLTPIFIGFSIAFFIRVFFEKGIKKLSKEKQTKAQLFLELKIFVSLGIILSAYNFFVHSFPAESGGKIIFGTLMLGLFIGIDGALIRERAIAKELSQSQGHLNLGASFLALPVKFISMSIIVVGSVLGVLMMVAAKDLEWIKEQGEGLDLVQAKISILSEMGFITLIIFAYILRIIFVFASNLRVLFENQNSVLAAVAQGNFEVNVPIASQDEFGVMAKGTNAMIQDLKDQRHEIQQTRDVIIHAMASLAETRDNETGAHILRTQNYVRVLAKKLQENPKHQEYLTDERVELMYKSAPLHDIGKVGIPDAILLKPGKLTDEEFDIMKTHATIGADSIEETKNELDHQEFLMIAKEIAAYHHEKWDGSGYPEKLSGENIPLSARLMALADVYDALITKRVYKPAFSHEKAKSIILEGKGKHFDPEVVEAFEHLEEEFIRISKTYQ